MKALDEELWRLGVMAKTEHNEAAPSQHELAPVFTTANIAADHNQLTMELMQKIARRFDMVCLLHEKPFAGVNGSGKHNNWSMITNTGTNLLEPGETPYENAQFLLFLCAVIQAVDDYQDMLRLSVASAGNDHRLGGHEAPPAVVSIFLGEELEAILQAIETEEPYGSKEKELIKVGVHVLPKFPKDTTDRNRTSPFAFTGNKFEFRMLGSSNSIACANIMLNSAVAQELKEYADELEKAEDFSAALTALIRRTLKEHKRIIFNGNGYDDSWIEEAVEHRGLSNLRTTPDCMPCILEKKNVEMLTGLRIYSEAELESRYEILLENYCKTVTIEAHTMVDMAEKEIIPAVEEYISALSSTAAAKKALCQDISCGYEKKRVGKLSALVELMQSAVDELDSSLITLGMTKDTTEQSLLIRDQVLPRMCRLRAPADEAETLTAKKYWPFPTYGDLLFGV